MIIIPNLDTTATIARLGIDPDKRLYYSFDKENNLLACDTLLPIHLARFLSVDPLTRKYPELTAYQFASNTPIQAIDIDGLEAFFIHGTSSTSARWKENPKTVPTLMRITNNRYKNTGFNWNAPLTNNEKDRAIAARQLVTYVLAHRVEGEEITLIGHSHGGNVAIQAADLIYKQAGQKVNIITIATPAYNDKNDAENPRNRIGINDHKAIWNAADGVSGGAAGDDYFTNSPKTDNTETDVSQYYPTVPILNQWGGETGYTRSRNPLDAHSFDVQHPEVIKQAINANKIQKLNPVNPATPTL